MKFKRTCLPLCLAFVMSAFTACGSSETNTADVTSSTVTTVTTETDTETSSAATSSTTSSVVTETTADTTPEEVTTVPEAGADLEIVPPDSEFLLEMFEIWCSDEVLENGKSVAIGASPSGSSEAFYTDIDGDGVKEFCFIIDSYHGSNLYVCDYADMQWKVVDVLNTANTYTYLQTNTDNTTSLFAVVGVRYVEGLDCYVYNNGVQEEFELLDKDKLYEELDQTTDINEQEEIYHTAINEALKEYDNLTYLYDLPHVQTTLLYSVHEFINEGLRREDFDEEDIRRQLDEFTAEVAELFDE